MTHKRRPTEDPDEKLFKSMPEDLRRLHKQAKTERRQKRREQWARENGIK